MCQATVLPRSIARCPSASTRWLLPVPLGPQTQSASARSIHSSVRSACWVRLRDRRGVAGPRRRRSCRRAARTRGGASGSSPGRGRRPPRRAGPAGPRRAPSAARSAVAITSGAARADVGHPQPAQQPVELVGQRRRRGGLDRHRAEALPGARGALQRLLLARARGELDHLRAAVREDRRQVAVAEAAGVRRDRERLVDVAGAVQLGQRDGLGELAPQPASRRPRPRRSATAPRPARSPGTPARRRAARAGVRSSAPAGRGG